MADTIPVTLYLDAATKRRLDALRPSGMTINGFCRAAILEHLKRYTTQPNPEELARLVQG